MGRSTEFTPPEIKRVPSRFRHTLSKVRLVITDSCDNCGLCIQLCPYGVYQPGRKRPRVATEHLCLGPSCRQNDFCCLKRCPQDSIRLNPNPSFEVLGDKRWTGDLLASTWYMAETGEVPYQDLNYKTGDSGGGFDKLRLLIPPGKALDCADDDISLDLVLNRTGDGRPEITIPVPFYLGGMSFGSISIHSMLSRVQAAAAWGSFCCTGKAATPTTSSPTTTTSLPRWPRVSSGSGKKPSSGSESSNSNTPRGPNPVWADTCWGTRSPRKWPACGKPS